MHEQSIHLWDSVDLCLLSHSFPTSANRINDVAGKSSCSVGSDAFPLPSFFL